MKKSLLLLVVLLTSISAWGHFVYIYSNPNSAGKVFVGTDMNQSYYSNGFSFTEAEAGETVYFGFSPYYGYYLSGIRFNNLSADDVTELQNGLYSFIMPDGKVSIWIDWASEPIIVTGVDINAENFPDENFRNWLLSQSYGTDGVITENEITSISQIDASSSGIVDLTGIEYFTLLTELILGNYDEESQENWNRITTLDLSSNPRLRKLDIDNNLVDALDVTNCPDLGILSCNNNQLTELDLSGNTQLEILSCSRNQLTELDFTNNVKLSQVFCDNNLLTTLDLSGKSELIILNCYDNQLTSFDVSGCTDLFQLYFYNNQIKGQAMEEVVNGLPYHPYAYLVVVDLDNEMEQNVITTDQVAVARAKGWSVEAISEEDFLPYNGTETAEGLLGDVNGDGSVKIGDVTALINYLLGNETSDINLALADCNHDDKVSIGDVTTLINYLLSGSWD
jgi:hypothetical protein